MKPLTAGGGPRSVGRFNVEIGDGVIEFVADMGVDAFECVDPEWSKGGTGGICTRRSGSFGFSESGVPVPSTAASTGASDMGISSG